MARIMNDTTRVYRWKSKAGWCYGPYDSSQWPTRWRNRYDSGTVQYLGVNQLGELEWLDVDE